jgi:ribosomal protein L32E
MAITFMEKVFECLGSYFKTLLDRALYFRTKRIANWRKEKNIDSKLLVLPIQKPIVVTIGSFRFLNNH